MKVEIFIPGIPRPGGSKTSTVIRRKGGEIVMVNGRPLTTTREAGKHTKEWRAVVSLAAMSAMRNRSLEPFAGPLRMDVTFFMPRPKYHFRSGKRSKELKPSAVLYHMSAPDRTKLQRSTEDAMTGIVWRDDAQVCDGWIRKIYGTTPGAHITIETMPEPATTAPAVQTPTLFGARR